MFKIIDSKDIVSYDTVREEYNGYLILMINDSEDTGKVYAIADKKDMTKIANLQIEMHDKKIDTHKINCLVGNIDSLIVRKCELL